MAIHHYLFTQVSHFFPDVSVSTNLGLTFTPKTYPAVTKNISSYKLLIVQLQAKQDLNYTALKDTGITFF